MEEQKLNLKKFEGTKARLENRITVTASNSFGYPRKFYKDNNIENFKYVVLYYDEKNKVIGFLFTNSEEEGHKYTLIKSKQGYGASIVATSFFRTYNLDSKKYRGRYDWEKRNLEGVGELYVIRLVERQEIISEPLT